MTNSPETLPTWAYFDPLTTQCPVRRQRAEELGIQPVDETQLCREAEPLYPGHKQPVTYCLGDAAIMNWDDADPVAKVRQAELASAYGLNGFVVDTYIGQKNGNDTQEMDVLDEPFVRELALHGLEFATMTVLASPRAVLPVPRSATGFMEADRNYDPTRGTVRAIIDTCARRYWPQDNHIRLLGRPYISVFTSDIRAATAQDKGALTLPDTIEYMKEYSNQEYGEDPYVVGVCLKADHAKPLFERGADAMTGYAFLSDFRDGTPIQQYDDLLRRRITDWHTIASEIAKPYVPPAVVGWDASPRGVNGVDLSDVSGVYPFTPIVEGSSSELFRKMLVEQRDFVGTHVPEGEGYTIITAWNEVTEGGALLPKVKPDGSVDDSYLAAMRSVITS
jgi:hypothetical protein